MTALKDDRQFTIVDPLQHDGFETSRGYLEPGEGGYIRTTDADLAQEIKEREPWTLVTEHESTTGGRGARGRSMMVVPELPWKRATANESWFDGIAMPPFAPGGTIENNSRVKKEVDSFFHSF